MQCFKDLIKALHRFQPSTIQRPMPLLHWAGAGAEEIEDSAPR